MDYCIVQVFGFILNKNELLKLVLKKIETDPKWIGEKYIPLCVDNKNYFESRSMWYGYGHWKLSEDLKIVLKECGDNIEWYKEYEDYIDEWSIEEELDYMFNDPRNLIGIGNNDKGQSKIRELIYNLPDGVKVFYNNFEHNNNYVIGIPTFSWDIIESKTIFEPFDLNKIHELTCTMIITYDRISNLLICNKYKPEIYICSDRCGCCV